MTKIKIKRVYEDFSKDDGFRILVDRLWPRGIKKEVLKFDLWDKDVTPSSDLRKWFHIDKSQNWDEFVIRYRLELNSSEALSDLVDKVQSLPVVTLLYASKEPQRNHAVILKEELEKRLKE